MTIIGVLMYLKITLPLSILFQSSDLERSSTNRNLKLKSLPSQIHESIWALPQFLFQALVEAPMLPKMLHQHRQIFPSTPDLNSSQSCIGDNFQAR